MANSRLNEALIKAIRDDDSLKVKQLLKEGADPCCEDSLKRSALYCAVASGELSSVIALLDAGADIEKQAEFFSMNTPLIVAAEFGHLEVVTELLKRGANLESTDVHGWTALFMAAKCLKQPVVELLLKQGAVVNIQSVHDLPYLNKETPLKRVVREIVSSSDGKPHPAGWQPSPQDFTIWQSKGFEIAKILIAHGADIDKCDCQHSTVVQLLKQYKAELITKSEFKRNQKTNEVVSFSLFKDAPSGVAQAMHSGNLAEYLNLNQIRDASLVSAVENNGVVVNGLFLTEAKQESLEKAKSGLSLKN